MKKIFSILIILLVGMACDNASRVFTPNIKQIRTTFEKRFEPVEEYYFALIDNGLAEVAHAMIVEVEREHGALWGYYHNVRKKNNHLAESDNPSDIRFIKELAEFDNTMRVVEAKIESIYKKREYEISDVRHGFKELVQKKELKPETIDNLRVKFLKAYEPIEDYVYALHISGFERFSDEIRSYKLESETRQLLKHYKKIMEEHPFKEGSTQEENELAEAMMYMYNAVNFVRHQVKERSF